MSETAHELGRLVGTIHEPVPPIGWHILRGRTRLEPMSGITDLGIRGPAGRFGGPFVVGATLVRDACVRDAEVGGISEDPRQVARRLDRRFADEDDARGAA